MEDLKMKNMKSEKDKDIVFSKAIKAGKRIYYLDVKKSRKDEMFLAITESKKIINGEGDESQVNFEKHKIFLYKEDFRKFLNGLHQVVDFIEEKQGGVDRSSEDLPDATAYPTEENQTPIQPEEIKIDIDF